MSYATLTTSIEDWSHRKDLGAVIPSFIKNAEAYFNRRLRVRSMEASLAETALVSGALTLPADFLSFKAVWETVNNKTIQPKTNEYIRTLDPVLADSPSFYALEGTTAIFWPTGGSVEGIYYKKIPDLQTNLTNWLDTDYADLYLYECLHHASVYMKNAQKALEYRSLSDRIIDEINGENAANSIAGGVLRSVAR